MALGWEVQYDGIPKAPGATFQGANVEQLLEVLALHTLENEVVEYSLELLGCVPIRNVLPTKMEFIVSFLVGCNYAQ